MLWCICYKGIYENFWREIRKYSPNPAKIMIIFYRFLIRLTSPKNRTSTALLASGYKSASYLKHSGTTEFPIFPVLWSYVTEYSQLALWYSLYFSMCLNYLIQVSLWCLIHHVFMSSCFKLRFHFFLIKSITSFRGITFMPALPTFCPTPDSVLRYFIVLCL